MMTVASETVCAGVEGGALDVTRSENTKRWMQVRALLAAGNHRAAYSIAQAVTVEITRPKVEPYAPRRSPRLGRAEELKRWRQVSALIQAREPEKAQAIARATAAELVRKAPAADEQIPIPLPLRPEDPVLGCPIGKGMRVAGCVARYVETERARDKGDNEPVEPTADGGCGICGKKPIAARGRCWAHYSPAKSSVKRGAFIRFPRCAGCELGREVRASAGDGVAKGVKLTTADEWV